MSKYFKVLFAALLVLALAAPAMADIKVNGYFRTQGQSDNVDSLGQKQVGGGDAPTETAIDNRFRAKVTNSLNEYVKLVYYGEVDMLWGAQSKGSIGGGGQRGLDGVNIETKNVYADFKVPNSIYSVRVGGQGIGGRYENVIIGDDAMALQVNAKTSDTMDVNFLYSKFNEGNLTEWDDNDFYGLNFNFKLANAAKLQLDAFWYDVNGNFTLQDDALSTDIDLDVTNSDIYYLGTFGVDSASEVDLGAFATTINTMFKAGAADMGVRFTYITGQDTTDTDATVFISDLGGTFQMPKDNLMIYGTDLYYNNLASQGVAWRFAKLFGMMALTAKADMKLPNDMYGKFGLGYFMTAEDVGVGPNASDELGFEIAGTVGKKVAEKVDLQVRAAYATAGDGLGTDADDLYKAVLQLNVPY